MDKLRTTAEVKAAREHAVLGGCCDRFADHKGCSCLDLAFPDGLQKTVWDVVLTYYRLYGGRLENTEEEFRFFDETEEWLRAKDPAVLETLDRVSDRAYVRLLIESRERGEW